MRRQNGFTMIELLIGITIMGILVAMAVPSFSDSIARRRLDGIATELSTDFQFTRTQSISTNANVSLVASATGYVIGTAKTITLDTRCSLSAVSPATLPLTITFEPNRGMTGLDAAISVACTSTAATLRVVVSSLGRVQICSPDGGFGGYPACV
jgi:prepilin-type N-terminal cleavage/methylation domain-containing protein